MGDADQGDEVPESVKLSTDYLETQARGRAMRLNNPLFAAVKMYDRLGQVLEELAALREEVAELRAEREARSKK